MNDKKSDLIERDAVLRVLSEMSHTQCASYHARSAILAIPAATTSGTKPSINWDHLRPDIVALTQDRNGSPYVYTAAPTLGEYVWHPEKGVAFWDASALASYKPGTCHWRDSLVMRPGYDGE